MQDSLDRFFNKKIASRYFKGACVLFGSARSIEGESYYGSVGDGIPNPVESNTLFDLQSISKVVSTVPLLLKLNESAALDIDAKVARWIPSMANGLASKISFRHLAEYSGGVSDGDCVFEFLSPEDEWDKMLRPKVNSIPGEAIEYADIGYRILGKAIERVANESLEKMANQLWHKAGMRRTTYQPTHFPRHEIASTVLEDCCVDDVEDRFLGVPVGCDGVFSTGRDLATYCQMILNNGSIGNISVLSPASIKAMATPSTAKSCISSSWYDAIGKGPKALGWELNGLTSISYSNRKGPLILEKAGGGGAFVWIDLEKNSFLIYLTNHGKPDPFTEDTWNTLVNRLAPHELSKLVYR